MGKAKGKMLPQTRKCEDCGATAHLKGRQGQILLYSCPRCGHQTPKSYFR